jgi:hypothetical protein
MGHRMNKKIYEIITTLPIKIIGALVWIINFINTIKPVILRPWLNLYLKPEQIQLLFIFFIAVPLYWVIIIILKPEEVDT